MARFGATSTADEVLEGHDLSGKIVLITGGYSGLGRETARAMAAKGAHIILSGRDTEKLEEAASEIAQDTGANVEALVCDLGSLDAVRQAAEQARQRFAKLDLLINNAGVMACPLGHTTDGFELQFGTNHLGHFLLTNLLVPLLEKGDQSRVITLSSRAHHRGGVDFDDPHYESRDYEKWEAYAQSKSANALFALELDKRLAPKGIRSFSVHPGGIMTNLGRHLNEEDVAMLRQRLEAMAKEAGESAGPAFRSVPQGAATTCWASTSDDVLAHGGAYCEDCQVAEQSDDNPTGGVRSWASDPEAASRLWLMSEDMVNDRFPW